MNAYFPGATGFYLRPAIRQSCRYLSAKRGEKTGSHPGGSCDSRRIEPWRVSQHI